MLKAQLSRLYSGLVNVSPVAPAHLARAFSRFDPARLSEFRELIIANLLEPIKEQYHLSDEGKADIETHINGRLNRFRNHYIAWIDSISPLRHSAVLEIGSGSGASTQALAEQGARVTGIDVDQKALAIARFRLRHSGQEASLEPLNADSIGAYFGETKFDTIIFFAALEHMTTGEKIGSLRQAYSLLKTGGALFVLEAPNRLWLYDFHTSFLPFYLWLPDDLAAKYASYSERQLFAGAVNEHTPTTGLARWGRGVSYHEFQLAGIPENVISAAKGNFEFHMRRHPLKKILYRRGLNYRYRGLLQKMAPTFVPRCFLEPFIDVALVKK